MILGSLKSPSQNLLRKILGLNILKWKWESIRLRVNQPSKKVNLRVKITFLPEIFYKRIIIAHHVVVDAKIPYERTPYATLLGESKKPKILFCQNLVESFILINFVRLPSNLRILDHFY